MGKSVTETGKTYKLINIREYFTLIPVILRRYTSPKLGQYIPYQLKNNL